MDSKLLSQKNFIATRVRTTRRVCLNCFFQLRSLSEKDIMEIVEAFKQDGYEVTLSIENHKRILTFDKLITTAICKNIKRSIKSSKIVNNENDIATKQTEALTAKECKMPSKMRSFFQKIFRRKAHGPPK